MEIRCSAGRDDIPLAFLFFPFLFSGGIGKCSSAGYDRKVPEYTEFLQNIQPRFDAPKEPLFEYNVSWFLSESNHPQTGYKTYIFPAQTWYTTWRNIFKYHSIKGKLDSLFLGSPFEPHANYLFVASFLDPRTQYPKLNQPKSCVEYTDLNRLFSY